MTVELILLTFLEKQKDQTPEYEEAVKSLAQALDKDGNLETDGVSPFRSCLVADSGSHPGVDEELCRRIGAQLAELGDRFEREALIKQEVVESLVNEILDESLTEDRFKVVVQSLQSNVPSGIEQEKASLAVAMLLTSKIGKSIPSLLHSCFATAVNFIQDNYNAYIEGLAEQR
ncbi:BH3-interacting domain death agonist [Mantella aurantiaca]